jgi:dolichol-phosphate mannosyltransferase
MINVPAWRVLISKGGNFLGRITLRLPIRDATSGYRAMNRKVLEATRLEETGFPIQLEETIKVAAKGFIMSEIPIILNNRKNGQSKFHFSLKLLRNYASVLRRGLKWQKEHSSIS